MDQETSCLFVSLVLCGNSFDGLWIMVLFYMHINELSSQITNNELWR